MICVSKLYLSCQKQTLGTTINKKKKSRISFMTSFIFPLLRKGPRFSGPCRKSEGTDTQGKIFFFLIHYISALGILIFPPLFFSMLKSPNLFSILQDKFICSVKFTHISCSTVQVDKQEKKKKRTGRAKRRIQYNRRFVNVVPTFGKKKGPNANS